MFVGILQAPLSDRTATRVLAALASLLFRLRKKTRLLYSIVTIGCLSIELEKP